MLKRLRSSGKIEVDRAKLDSSLEYVDREWANLEVSQRDDEGTLIGLPNNYLVPSRGNDHSFEFDEMYYWDSYFMCQPFLQSRTRPELVIGIIENLLWMFSRFGLVPNASRVYMLSRSQPPLLSSLILEAHQAYGLEDCWLQKSMALVMCEYEQVWMGKKKPHMRRVYKGLSRYYDINMIDDLAEAESGWDMTTRFSGRALDFLPIDLNSMLYKYEMDFARSCEMLGAQKDAKIWKATADARSETVHKLMWRSGKGMFFDYDYKNRKKSNVMSLAMYFAMWAEMVDKKTAEKMAKQIRLFQYPGGLSTTAPIVGAPAPPATRAASAQWSYPNGWAPLHFIVTEGLEKYGFHEQANHIARLWVRTITQWHHEHGVILEKYNVSSPESPPKKGLYPDQVGFGWTNAVLEFYAKKYFS